MLPAYLETDESKTRKPFDIRVVPNISPTAQILKHQTCMIEVWPYDKNVTYFAIRGKFSNIVHDVLLPIAPARFMKAYAEWVNGTHVQEAFSMFDSAVREFIQTGTTPTEWDELMGAAE